MSSAFTALLGERLQSKDGFVKTEQALAGMSAVGLYFSAHWCPPCRGFTPVLAESYKTIVGEGKPLEIIFISSDRDEDSFKEYFGEQPWLALPYAERNLKGKLSKKYKVNGIPSLVILDADANIITKDGRSCISEDPKGTDFPWTPPTVWEALGDEFLSGTDGETVEIDEIKKPGKVIGLYFSAHWCPPCKMFTPQLVKTYNAIKAAGKDFEIIFVSSDRSQESFMEYFGEMPWLAIPTGDPRKEKLSKLYEVEGIPSFVLIDSDGKTINAKGRQQVSSDPEGANFPWPPEDVESLEAPDGINEETSLCLLLDGCDSATREAADAVLRQFAAAQKKTGSEMLFFVACNGEGAVSQVRKLAKLDTPSTLPQLLLLDIPDEGGYYTAEPAEVTAESLASFLDQYQNKQLERKQLG